MNIMFKQGKTFSLQFKISHKLLEVPTYFYLPFFFLNHGEFNEALLDKHL